MLSPAPLQNRLQAQHECLGPKVAVVARKLDSTVGQICFRRIFQTVRNHGGRHPRSLARSERVLRWFSVKLGWWWRSSLAGVCSKGVAGDASHSQNPFGLKMGRNDPVRCSRSWGVFSRVLELKMNVLGLGFYLAPKTRFI